MKTYIFKYNQPYNEQVFEKDCIKTEDKFLPLILNNEVIGKCKVSSDEIGCYFEEIEYQEDKIKLDPNFSNNKNHSIGYNLEFAQKLKTINENRRNSKPA